MLLFVMTRHGEEEFDGEKWVFGQRGKRQMEAIAVSIKPRIKEGLCVRIVSSVVERAAESAKVISSALGVSYEKHNDLCHFGGGNVLHVARLAKSLSETADILIFVGHLEAIRHTAGNLCKAAGIVLDRFDSTAFMIDYESGILTSLPDGQKRGERRKPEQF